MVRIHDSLAKRAVELTPRVPGRVSMYVCGPTVYDNPHIGHGRFTLVWDVIRRYLEWSGLEVRFVSNVTDIDDNIINRAQRDQTTEPELAAKYEAEFAKQFDRLNILKPDETPRATMWIAQMQALIAQLIDRGRREGSIPPGPPVTAVARTFVGAIEGAVIALAGQAPHDELLAARAAAGVLGLDGLAAAG